MSDFIREKVLRLPVECFSAEEFKKTIIDKLQAQGKAVRDIDEDLRWDAETVFPEVWGWAECGKFQWSPTYPRKFVDFVLEAQSSSEGEWGKIRELYPTEKAKYLPIFQKVLPGLKNLDDVRLVEYCWFDCCEAPDYYDFKDDPFYAEV